MSSLKLSNDALARLLDALPGGLLLLDARGQVQFANGAAQALSGCRAGFGLRELKAALGARAAEWLERALLLGGVPAGEAPAGLLADGRRLRLQLLALGDGLWALQCALEGGQVAPQTQEAGLPRLASEPEREMLGLFGDSPFPASLQDVDFRLTAVNRAFAEFIGLPTDQLIGRDFVRLVHEEDRPMMLALRDRVRAGPDTALPALIERRLVDATGRQRWVRLAVHAVLGDRGKRVVLAVLQDCTAEKLARDAVERSAHELDQWFDLSPVGMVLFDAAGLLVRSNAAFEALVGHVPVALDDAGVGLQQLLGWRDDAPHEGLRPGAPPLQWHVTLTLPDGRTLRLRALVRGFETAAQQRRYMAVVEDRSIEDERDLAQLAIGALMDTTGVGIATFHESRGWVRSAAPTLAGAAPDGATVQPISRELVDAASLPEYERLQQALLNGERVEVRYAVRHPDLGRRWLLTRVEPGPLASGQRTTSVVTLDVTEQQRAQQRNEQLLAELSTILEQVSAGVAYLRGDVLVRCNRRFEEVLGITDGRVAGETLPALFARRSLPPELVEQTHRALAGGRACEAELMLPDGDVGAQWLALSVRSVGTTDGAVQAIALMTDITRLKLQQAELVTLARDRELMFSLSEVGIAYVRGGRVERANGALAVLTGYTPLELMQLHHAILFEDRAAYLAFLGEQERLRPDGRSVAERRLRRRDGSLLWVQASARLVDDSDPQRGVICAYVDIDERRRAQALLERQADRTRAILDSLPVAIVTVGREGVQWMNSSARRMLAGELEDFVGRPICAVATDEPDHPLRLTHYLDALADGESEAFECRLRARDGREFWVAGNAVVTGRERASQQVTFALLDIERRRQAELRTAHTQASLHGTV
jgi:PAS domain S-box-containing protein